MLDMNKPVIEVEAIDERDFLIEQLASGIDKAREQVKRGEVVSQEQVLKQFGVWQ